MAPKQRQDPSSPLPEGIWHLLRHKDRHELVVTGQDLTALSGCIDP